MRLLDLFCGAGGAAMGYHRAGFEVVGVDIEPQPRYPFEFIQADALEFLADLLPPHGWHRYDAIHASPPCQAFTTISNRYRGSGGPTDEHPELIAPIREMLRALDVPWVIENVVGAKREMCSPVLLHGGMFGLGVYRPRLFESNVLLHAWPAAKPTEPVGVYGKKPDGRLLWERSDGSEMRCVRSLEEGRVAMGIDWMEWREMCESIPPAYTEWIGHQLMEHLR